MKQKAALEELNNLHGMVAEQLTKGLDDPKTLALAIKFLKDNEITADMIESESMMSLTDSIKTLALEAKNNIMSVDDMLQIAQKA